MCPDLASTKHQECASVRKKQIAPIYSAQANKKAFKIGQRSTIKEWTRCFALFGTYSHNGNLELVNNYVIAKEN
jgi:hypothetical protein